MISCKQSLNGADQLLQKNSMRQRSRCRRRRGTVPLFLSALVVVLCGSSFLNLSQNNNSLLVYAASDDYYTDDANADDAANDDGANGDDDNNNGDDDANNNGDDNDDNNQGYQVYNQDDDNFHWDESISFDLVSVMPVSCVNYNNGHMIKYELFENESGKQCHFRNIDTFVVSIAHYMRAYFNYQALTYGKDFKLPGDAGYLNCILLQETAYSQTKLYAKIGCMDRETFTSTKLELHVYTDSQCSVPYDDGRTSRYHASKGYDLSGYTFSTKVSFRPPFYSCQTCAPEAVSGNFNKKNGNWYDDDYISQYGQKQAKNDDGNGMDDYYHDDYYDDDFYHDPNDDVAYQNNYNNNGNDDGQKQNDDDGNNDDQKYDFDDDYYNRQLMKKEDSPEKTNFIQLEATSGQLKAYHDEFWREFDKIRSPRILEDGDNDNNNDYYNVGDWNMCERIYTYGMWCDAECRKLDSFRVDSWSKPDIFLLVVMCIFMAAMMVLVLIKRFKASQKAKVYGDGDTYKPGLPPFVMLSIFILILVLIAVLAKLKFVNETLVFAVVACILLFIYMLKLTLFENRRPVLLAAPRHEMFDNPIEERLFD